MRSEEWLPNNRRDETPAERADRNFVELLQEFRVLQQGLIVLFAFLLTVPFTSQFQDLSNRQEWFFFTALLSAAFGTVLLVSPVSHHRILFRKGLKFQIVQIASRFAQAAMVALLVSMMSSVYLVASVVFDYTVALWLAILGLLSALVMWYAVPIYYRHIARRARVAAILDPPADD